MKPLLPSTDRRRIGSGRAVADVRRRHAQPKAHPPHQIRPVSHRPFLQQQDHQMQVEEAKPSHEGADRGRGGRWEGWVWPDCGRQAVAAVKAMPLRQKNGTCKVAASNYMQSKIPDRLL